MSDLHLDHWEQRRGSGWFGAFLKQIQTDADVLVLAGDVVSFAPRNIGWTCDRLCDFKARYPRVVYVPGNHEHYTTSIDEGMAEAIEACAATGVDLLRTGVIAEIGGHRFLGGTMWQPHTGRFAQLAEKITDHYAIKGFRQEANREFKEFKAFLEKNLRAGDVVVSHHAPSWGSLAPQWLGHPCNRFFITPEMEPLILDRKPELWAHGHVHTPFDYVLGDTRVVANPLGYPGEAVQFNHKMIVELP